MVSSNTGNEQATGGGTEVDELLDSLGLDEGAPATAGKAGAPTGASGSSGSPSWALWLGALALAAVFILGAIFLLTRSSGDSETATDADAAATSDAAPAAPGSTDLEATAADVQATLGRLGFDEVEASVRDSVIYLDGSVPSDQDLSTLRSTVLSSVDANSIDLSGIGVAPPQIVAPIPQQGPPGQGPPPGAPGAPPPPGFVPPTPEQQENLQQELNRVLQSTPLVFDVGSTMLNELQLEVLNSTIIGLLEAHPGVPVRLVGYTDESGSDAANDLLSIDRANAVRDYLISQGVPEFIVRAEGRGEQDASGDAGADRRVEIEVITTPGG